MIERLTSIMARLRDPVEGCEWDRAQTWSSIAPYTIEEAYEVADAIARDHHADIKDELGDLLLQVVFHSRIAEESGAFDLADVVTAISDKMERRHPHIFGDARTSPGWETIKASERSDRADGSALAGVASGLPALARAEKLQKRAARVGFDWPDATGPLAKVFEEIEEVRKAGSDTVAEEVGDLLFAVTNWARHLGVDPEAALRAGNAKFEARFRAIEVEGGAAFAGSTLDQKEELWATIKRRGG
ncbi:nucleoside triphosphate hydrolase [Sphingomonas sp. HMP9]|uniref:nucleoside triphosphate pyrophosphohydrolase n=1 Tax=Sphingomonas sp. HMP9 TaxID=1517554 RepID=UPI001596A9FC|nr:nucleoside triphosphate pyrophosphohydrolase [Sphingomonas sp. HMP9]BCA61471.1 nucleoside triphosphate hydrolase [Sphingomonas sp. HMP9]